MVAPRVPAHSSFETGTRPLPALLTGHEPTAARIIEGAEAAAINVLAPNLHRLHPAAELTALAEHHPICWALRSLSR